MVLAAAAVFIATTPLPASAAGLTVTPSTNLPSSANVNVSGTGFAANQPGTLQECKFNSALGVTDCKVIGTFTTNASGSFGPVAVTVTSTYVSSDGKNVSCLPENSCAVVATLDNVTGVAEAPISFAGASTGATITTQATPTASVGQPIVDTATVTGPPVGPQPTGTVTFTLYGPDDATCAGPAAFTSLNRPLSGNPPTATSETFTGVAGTYRWVAVYSGDANYAPVTSPCNDPNEISVVSQPTATITTQATPSVTLGSPISDTATVTVGTGAPAPTGTVTFTLFGPDNATCAGTPIFTSSAQPLTPGAPYTASSGPFTPSAPGTYRWIASYSGDANYAPVTSPCNAENETSQVVSNEPVCTITGSEDDDRIVGTEGPDVICGLGGNDELIGKGGADILIGGDGHDELVGGDGRDELYGGNGRDILRGGADRDFADGGPGFDRCNAEVALSC